MIGKTLAHYQIESSLGAGGMGEVYLARDKRLGRSVAVTGRLHSVKIHTQPTFSFENPVALPSMNFVASGRLRNWDITPDGKQFIGVVPAGQASTGLAATAQIQVVLNWFEELKQRMAAQ